MWALSQLSYAIASQQSETHRAIARHLQDADFARMERRVGVPAVQVKPADARRIHERGRIFLEWVDAGEGDD